MTDLLDRMLAERDLSVVFQPIFHLADDPALVAVEALTRGPRGTHFESASVFFDYVRLKHQELAVDRHCIENAIAAAAALPSRPRLSINVHAATLERDDDFPAFLGALCDDYSIDAGMLIVEMVEQSPYWNAPRLLGVLRELRSMGIGIAVDDVGFGHGNFRMILDARPEYMKIDRYFVGGCGSDSYRRSLLRSVCQLARDFGSIVVAEGIETEQDLRTVRDLQIPFGQGYLLAPPTPTPEFAAYRPAACEERAREIPI